MTNLCGLAISIEDLVGSLFTPVETPTPASHLAVRLLRRAAAPYRNRSPIHPYLKYESIGSFPEGVLSECVHFTSGGADGKDVRSLDSLPTHPCSALVR